MRTFKFEKEQNDRWYVVLPEWKGKKDELEMVSSSRLLCAKNGKFKEIKDAGGAVAYAWYVWEKGYKGETIIKWFN